MRLTHKSRISMVLNCLKNYRDKIDIFAPKGITPLTFPIDIDHSLYFHNSNPPVKIKLLIANPTIKQTQQIIFVGELSIQGILNCISLF